MTQSNVLKELRWYVGYSITRSLFQKFIKLCKEDMKKNNKKEFMYTCTPYTYRDKYRMILNLKHKKNKYDYKLEVEEL